MSEYFDLEKGLLELFKYAFITNCHLDQASVTQQEMKTLQQLDALEVLQNFKDLIQQILNFKKQNKASSQAEVSKRAQQLQAMVQKLQAEVRNHIRIQHQLKLHVESTQGKLEDLKKENPAPQLKKQKKVFQQKLQKLTQMTEKQQKSLQVQNKKLKEENDLVLKQNEKLKIQLSRLKNTSSSRRERPAASIENLKKKMQEKAVDVNYNRRNKPSRKSMGEVDLNKFTVSSNQRPPSSKIPHYRSYSDYKPSTSRRPPSHQYQQNKN